MNDRGSRWYKSLELWAFVGALILMAGTGGFLALAEAVSQGRTQQFDQQGIRDLRWQEDLATPVGPIWLHEVARDITALGGVAVLSSVTVAVAGFFVLGRKFDALAMVLTAVIGGMVIGLLLKVYFGRPRPHVVPHLCAVDSSSFPSGHAMMSAIVYVTAAALFSRMTDRRQLKLYLFAVALLLTGLVGASRLYLGVHYPTDILAGWLAGSVWLTFCWLAARHVQRPKLIDSPVGAPSARSLRA